MEYIELLRRSLNFAKSPRIIFGEPDEAHDFYRELAQRLHPDRGGTTEAFQALTTQYEDYEDYDGVGNSILLRTDEICESFTDARGMDEHKFLRNPRDGDLLHKEIQVLSLLERNSSSTFFYQLFPHVSMSSIGSAAYIYAPTGIHSHHLITLEEFLMFYDDELDVRHLGWIWHRLLRILGFAHNLGIVHGGINSKSILVGPQHHDVVLTNWYFSALQGAPLEAISSEYLYLYPAALQREDIDRNSLVSQSIPGLDIYMAAKVMLNIFHNVLPHELADYFETLALHIPHVRVVLTSTQELVNNFDSVIYDELHWNTGFVPCQWINWENERNA